MTREAIKSMFSTFQNLNLAALREDLRRGLVARGDWVDRWAKSGYIVCPVAHGWRNSHCWNSISRLDADFSTADGALGAGLDAGGVDGFISWWDCERIDITGHKTIMFDDDLEKNRRNEFTEIIEEIWQERLTDADAVQGVIEEASETESVAQEVVACR